MTIENEFKILVGGYFGVQEMDEYDLKVYVMKEIEEYIINFVKLNPIEDYDYNLEALYIKDKVSLKRKLQDSILTLRKINGPLELEHMVKLKLQELKNDL